MYVRNWLTLTLWKRSLRFFQAVSTELFGLGLFLGVVAVSMWQQWRLTFGQDPLLMLVVSAVVALAFSLGQRWQQSTSATSSVRPLTSLIMCLAAWTVLHPFWIDALTVLMGSVPSSVLENVATKSIALTTLAALGWVIPGTLWSATLAEAAALTNETPLAQRCGFSIVLSGVASGLLLNVLVVSPVFGVFVPAVVAAIFASGLALQGHRISVNGVDAHTGMSALTPGRGSHITWVRVGMACLVGGLLACHLRLANQLLPQSAFLIFTQISGVCLGIACGLFRLPRQRPGVDRATWGGLAAAATSSLLLAIQPSMVDFSLWMNSSFTFVTFLLAARVGLLMAIAFPFGAALAWIADSTDDAPRGFVAWGAPLIAGLGIATFLLGGMIDLIPMMASCGGLLLIAAGLVRIHSSGWSISLRTASGMGALVALAMSFPMWRSCDDPARTAKLLFSTPTFLAYRAGWDIEHLPFLDDIRMIGRQEGRSGPLTLWRGRVAELYVRESGIPRAVITKDSDAIPQFAPEVLQAVYPLVISDQPGRVLLLGLSAGVPLSTCLNFPIREAVCVEGDSNLIKLVQGPLAQETGFDPLSDDRVTLKRISPELALMTQPAEPFDVILSSPASSSLAEGSASFTQEFYQRASRQLAERGLFCQRFECVDYGPEPMRMVLKAIQTAFRRVIAIETSAGELLLLGSNSEDVFIPGDLAARLETSHVCRVLARSGLDWSTLLNQPTYDHAALKEICDESRCATNSMFNGQLAVKAPMEVMRWANKQQEVQSVLTANRVSAVPFLTDEAKDLPSPAETGIYPSRRSRLVEWLGEGGASQELLRRLAEVVAQRKVVHENPDAHWWEYRKTLRKQLQDRPRTAVQQVKAIEEKPSLHPEDVRRKHYFSALGNAAHQEKPTREQIAAVEQFLEPYDPLVSYFARQETADMLGRSGEDPGRELSYRLHVIYFAPTLDASVRNVAKALEALIKNPEAIPDDSVRFDALNGLIQTLRIRWEVRQSLPESSTQKTLDDLDRSLIAVEKGVSMLDQIVPSAGIPQSEWQTRKEVIERLMIRPLMSFRVEVQSRQARGRAQAKAIFENLGK